MIFNDSLSFSVQKYENFFGYLRGITKNSPNPCGFLALEVWDEDYYMRNDGKNYGKMMGGMKFVVLSQCQKWLIRYFQRGGKPSPTLLQS